MKDNLYVISLKWYPIMGGPSQPDEIHAIANDRAAAIEEGMRHAFKRPLYPLSCWTPAIYDCVCKGEVNC